MADHIGRDPSKGDPVKCDNPDASHLECAADHVSQSLCADLAPMSDRDLVTFYALSILQSLQDRTWDKFLPVATEYDRDLWADRQESLI